MAEGYNPANQQDFTPILTSCVKPWLIGNQDPGKLPSVVVFVDPTTGQVENPAPIGEQFWLSSDCSGPPDSCSAVHSNPPDAKHIGGPTSAVYDYFVPLKVTPNPGSPGDICPSSTASPCGGGIHVAYKQAIECCNVSAYSCGGTVSNANRDTTLDPEYQDGNSDLALGTECLIHTSGTGLGNQDTLDWSTFPNGPPKVTAGSGPQGGNNVSTSSSIVTIPILDTATFSNTPPYPVTVMGFLQAFVNSVDDINPGNIFGPIGHHADVSVTVMNVIGCSQTPILGRTPVIGGNGASPIPVRLISPQ
jgi:hypothetical protein